MPDTTGTTPDTTVIENQVPIIREIPALSLQPGRIAEVVLDQFAQDDGPFTELTWSSSVSPAGVVQVGINEARVASVTAIQDSGEAQIIFTVTDAQGASANATVDASITPIAAGDFSGDGTIGFDDCFLFADALGLTIVHPAWDPIFDLDADGRISFEDFFIFAELSSPAREAETSPPPAVSGRYLAQRNPRLLSR